MTVYRPWPEARFACGAGNGAALQQLDGHPGAHRGAQSQAEHHAGSCSTAEAAASESGCILLLPSIVWSCPQHRCGVGALIRGIVLLRCSHIPSAAALRRVLGSDGRGVPGEVPGAEVQRQSNGQVSVCREAGMHLLRSLLLSYELASGCQPYKPMLSTLG